MDVVDQLLVQVMDGLMFTVFMFITIQSLCVTCNTKKAVCFCSESVGADDASQQSLANSHFEWD